MCVKSTQNLKNWPNASHVVFGFVSVSVFHCVSLIFQILWVHFEQCLTASKLLILT